MEKTQIKENNIIARIGKGILIAMIITIVSLIIFSIILANTNITENMVNPVIMIITAISILVASSIENTKIKKNGLLNGALIGGIYILSIYLISSLLNWRFYLNFQGIIMIVLGMIFGILGGIVGVNKK